MSRTIRPWPSIRLFENSALHLPCKAATDSTALYHLRMCEWDVIGGERIIRLLTRRAEASRLGLHPPGVLEITESDRAHVSIAEDQHGLIEALLGPFDRMNGGER